MVNSDYNQGMYPGANQVYSGLPATAGATLLSCPALYDQYWGWISSVNVQNVGETQVTVDYWYSDGQHEQATIPSWGALLKVYMNGSHDDYFGVRLESTGMIVAVANAANVYGASAQTYECAATFSDELYTPVTMKWYDGQYITAIQVQNLDWSPADICVEYEGDGLTCHNNIPGNGVTVFFTWLENLPDGWVGWARASSTANIAAVVNRNNGSQSPPAGDFAMGVPMLPVVPQSP